MGLISLDQFKRAFNPRTNGISESINRTNEAFNNSVKNTNEVFQASIEKTKADLQASTAKIDSNNKSILENINTSNSTIKKAFDDSNTKIGDQLQANLQSTKNQLDLNLNLTKQTINMDALQQSANILSTIGSFTPFGFIGLEIANRASDGKVNQYLNNSQSRSNPLFENISGFFGFGNNDKILESSPDLGIKLNPFPDLFPENPPAVSDPNSGYSGKYSQFDSSGEYNKNSGDEMINLKYIVPVVIGSGILIMILGRKK